MVGVLAVAFVHNIARMSWRIIRAIEKPAPELGSRFEPFDYVFT